MDIFINHPSSNFIFFIIRQLLKDFREDIKRGVFKQGKDDFKDFFK